MIRAAFWKEWREHRLKYGAYWLALNLPILIPALCIAVNKSARAPFADLSNATAMKYLGLAMVVECFAVVTIFMLATGFLAAATFSPEQEDRSVFFLFEQPVERWRYPACKLLHGLVQIGAAIVFAVLFAPFLAWLFMLAGGRVTFAGSLGTMQTLMFAGMRGALCCWLVSAIIFAACALITSIWPRWWIATVGVVISVIAFSVTVWNFFDLLSPSFENMGNGSISFGSGSPQWVTITQALPLSGFPAWKPLPIATALAAIAILGGVSNWIISRRELK
jgi:ABC-type transport system involved in multi-copper enzyme maturation permease subunit